jgi:predicted GNAT superfamily acetyltransferase
MPRPMGGRARITIRPLARLDELRACERLQKEVWRFADIEVVPCRLMAVMNKSGALVLGALRGRRLLGFSFGFPGIREGRLLFCSHMLAVHPSVQDAGIGRRLKLRQRRELLDRGFGLAAWTFDPIEARNAYLYVAKLGCVAWDYWVNLYGRTTSVLHRGLDTDRLAARWYLRSSRVRRALSARRPRAATLQGAGAIHETRRVEGGVRAPGALRLDLDAPRLAFEIPAETGRMRRDFPALARRWQQTLRTALQAYFAGGYAVSDFASVRDGRERRTFYILDKRTRKEMESA